MEKDFSNNLSGVSYLCCHLKSRDKLTSKDVVVITGCGSGLGYSLALHCRQLGATVIAGVLQMESPAVQKLEDEGVIVFPLDLMELNSTTGFTDSVRRTIAEKKLGKLLSTIKSMITMNVHTNMVQQMIHLITEMYTLIKIYTGYYKIRVKYL